MKPITTMRRGLIPAAAAAQAQGRNGDKLLAHITPQEAVWLHRKTDGGTINPRTGLLEFWGDGTGSGGAEGDHGGDTSSSGSTSNDMGGASSGGSADGTGSGGDDPGGGGEGNSSDGPTGIGVIDRAIENARQNPVATGINTAFGLAAGPLGWANTASGLLGGPTVGSMATAAARAATESPSVGPGAPGPGPGPGNSGDLAGADGPGAVAPSFEPSEAQSKPSSHAPVGLLTAHTSGASQRPRPNVRFSGDYYRDLYVYDPLVGRMVPRPS